MPCAKNEGADLLAKMASASPMNITHYILVEFLHKSSIEDANVLMIVALSKLTWKDDIITYLLEGNL